MKSPNPPTLKKIFFLFQEIYTRSFTTSYDYNRLSVHMTPLTVDFFHIPAAISLPHFYLGAKKYQEAVKGMRPSKEEHQTIIDAEPVWPD